METIQDLISACKRAGMTDAGRLIRQAIAEQHRNTRHDAIECILNKVSKTDLVIVDAITQELTSEIMNLRQRSPLD